MSNNNNYDYLRERISLEEVCSLLGMKIVQKGADKWTLCPFHNDHNPSMKLYKNEGFEAYHCFTCGAHGDIFSLIEKVINCNFSDCMKWIETQFPSVVRETGKSISRVKDLKKSGFQIALENYKSMSPIEHSKLVEFSSSRGYQSDFLIEHEIYYVTSDKLLHQYINDDEVRNILIESFLLNKIINNDDDSGLPKLDYQSVFKKDKIMITLRDHRNQIIGYAARAVNNSKPKYLFTKKLPKSDFLYGLNTIQKTYAGKSDQIIQVYITEGVFDALRLTSLGFNSVAVLGSHITQNQTMVLAHFISDMDTRNNHVFLTLFLDSDEAGMKGANSSIRNLWLNNIIRTMTIIDVCINKKNFVKDETSNIKKDPDEIFKDLQELQNEQLDQYKIDSLEFLLRYALDETSIGLERYNSFSDMYRHLSLEQQVAMLGKVSHTISMAYWQDVFDVYNVFEHALPNNNFVLNLLKKYFGLLKNSNSCDIVSEKIPDYDAFSIAIEVAKSSYIMEETPLDESTWNRLFYTVDIFNEFFSDYFAKGNHLNIPLISFDMPKKANEYRPKKMYCHEQLIMQQYVLNELLREDAYRNYQYSIPAVRYDPQQKPNIYVTGDEYYKEHTDQVVSFAYQINMPVINGECPSTNGMFRQYYDCWKSFIDYIRDGINKMQVDRIYKVKLDISKYYDNVTSYSVQRLLQDKIQNALEVTNNRFSFFGEDENKATRIAKWVIDELFNYKYYRPDTGKKEAKENTLRGIPQGPNLSAYVANALLFDLDFSVLMYINDINQLYQKEHPDEIAVRYARYVDDMVIVAVKSEYLLDIQEIIAQKLGELELTLSQKTDDAICIEKEDAYDWLISENGGLGVSVASDEAIESAEDIFNLVNESNSIDRRKALSMLNSYSMDISMFTDDTRVEIITTFCKSEEVRFNDIVRFSALYIKYLKNCGTESLNLLQRFIKDLEIYCTSEYCPSESMLLREGILTLAFLQACINILKSVGNEINDQYRKIIVDFVRNNHDLSSQFILKNKICQRNKWLIYIKLLQMYQMTADIIPDGEALRCPAEIVLKEMDQLNINRNEYRIAWQFAIEDSCGIMDIGSVLIDSFSKITNEEVGLSKFHHAVHYLSHISNNEEFNQLNVKISHNIPEPNIINDPLYRCLWLWFPYEPSDKNVNQILNDQNIQAALSIFINIVNSNAIAEIVANNVYCKQCLFLKGINMEYIPVPPGVNYPGIIAVQINQDQHVKEVNRVEFNLEDSEKYVNIPPTNFIWNDCQSISQKCHSVQSVLSKGWMTLQKYLQIKVDDPNQENLVLERIGQIAHIHELLSNCIKEYEEKNNSQNLIFSHSNILVNDGKPYIITYQIDENVCGVAVSQGKSVRFQSVSNTCNHYWKAGMVIKDALNLKALDNSIYTEEQYEILVYILKRLSGEQFTRYSFLNSEQSYNYSVVRARQALRDYAERKDPQERKLFLTNYKLINTFIAHRLEQGSYTYCYGDLEYHFAMYAKECLFCYAESVGDLLSNAQVLPQKELFKRRVPLAYLTLGSRLSHIHDYESCSGISLLKSGLYALAVMTNIKQQVTEYVFSLTSEERSGFLRALQNSEVDYSWELLCIDITQVKLVINCNNQIDDLTNILKELLELKNNRKLKQVTPIGWLVMLCFLMELNKTEQFIVKRNSQKYSVKSDLIQRKILLEHISKMAQCFQNHDDVVDFQNYPFEGTYQFIETWTETLIEEIISDLNIIDEWNNIYIEKKSLSIFDFAVNRQKVSIYMGGYEPLENKPLYFMTYQSLRANTEKEVDDTDKYVWTQSTFNNKFIGISAIDKALSKLAFPIIKEERSYVIPVNIKTQTPDANNLPTKNSDSQDPEEILSVSEAPNSNPTNKETNSSEDELIQHVQKMQWQNWGDRSSKFANIDRIALLQFDSESSYLHPESEVCSLDAQKGEVRYSCSELRRRKILEKVFTACNRFKVEILLLPEYSVRPETVIWIKKMMDENNFQFSIWAGTFRIPANSDHTIEDILNPPKGTKIQSNIHSAVLPVIMHDTDKQVKILHRFKKYPAVNLQEVIHPQIMDSTAFQPILRRDNNELYRDARDDIIELICAEVFVITSPSNHNQAMRSAFKLYQRYEKSHYTWKEFQDKCFSDIKEFGENTALHQFQNKYGRHSIVLVPACTTRATDYYVLGQASYLAAGLTTVFCNMTSGGNGGSCFIGTNSWDKNKSEEAEFIGKYSPDDTPYYGISPGIYQQNLSDECRGALGKKEQALVICDINPQISFDGKPNPESMGKQLELIAHLPIIETSDCSEIESNIEECGLAKRKCRCLKAKEMDAGPNKTSYKYLLGICNSIKKVESKQEIDAELAKEIRDVFKSMGKNIHSDWLVNRGEQFYKQYNNLYQNLLSPNLLDWIYINVKYPGDDKDNDKNNAKINVPIL